MVALSSGNEVAWIHRSQYNNELRRGNQDTSSETGETTEETSDSDQLDISHTC